MTEVKRMLEKRSFIEMLLYLPIHLQGCCYDLAAQRGENVETAAADQASVICSSGRVPLLAEAAGSDSTSGGQDTAADRF